MTKQRQAQLEQRRRDIMVGCTVEERQNMLEEFKAQQNVSL